jgi:hypothetical protein
VLPKMEHFHAYLSNFGLIPVDIAGSPVYGLVAPPIGPSQGILEIEACAMCIAHGPGAATTATPPPPTASPATPAPHNPKLGTRNS